MKLKKILTFGVFDYFHIGHLRLFKQAKQYGNYLIVAVQSEEYIQKYKPTAKVLYSTAERVEILSSLKIVDKVLVYDTVCVETLEKIDFDVLALGEDHVGGRFNLIEKWCINNGKDVVRLKRTAGISSTIIKDSIVGELSDVSEQGGQQ